MPVSGLICVCRAKRKKFMETQIKKHGGSCAAKNFIFVTLFVAGDAIGASVLGLPIVMHRVGFIPACLACILMSILMAVAELLMARLFIESGAGDLSSAFAMKLGKFGANLFNASYFLLFFCLLVAYWNGTGAILEKFPIGRQLFFLIICLSICCLFFGFRVAGPVNTFLTICMGASFLWLGAETLSMESVNLAETMNFGAVAASLPIVVCSYCFHDTIPTICRQLEYNKMAIKWAVICGILFPLTLNVGVLFIGFRVLSAHDLAIGAQNGWPVFVALADKLSSRTIAVAGNAFSLFAILSSLVGVTTTMSGAVREIFADRRRVLSAVKFVIILLLPLLISATCPGIFLRTLEFSGGILSNLMVGILPIAVLIRERRIGCGYGAVLLIFLLIFCLEINNLLH
jgi:tyrosine-specific transport protein